MQRNLTYFAIDNIPNDCRKPADKITSKSALNIGLYGRAEQLFWKNKKFLDFEKSQKILLSHLISQIFVRHNS